MINNTLKRGGGDEMEPIQLQTTAQLIKDQFIIQVTSGCDILFESNCRCVEKDVSKAWIEQQIWRAFCHALNVKMEGGE